MSQEPQRGLHVYWKNWLWTWHRKPVVCWQLQSEWPTFHTATVRWALRSRGSLTKWKNKQLAPFHGDSSRISRGRGPPMYTGRNAANRCRRMVFVRRNRGTRIHRRSTESQQGVWMGTSVCVCVCLFASEGLEEHATEVQGSSNIATSSWTDRIRHNNVFNMFSLGSVATKPKVNESAALHSFWYRSRR